MCSSDDAFSDNLSQKADSEASSGPLLDDKGSLKNDAPSPCEPSPDYNFGSVMGRYVISEKKNIIHSVSFTSAIEELFCLTLGFGYGLMERQSHAIAAVQKHTVRPGERTRLREPPPVPAALTRCQSARVVWRAPRRGVLERSAAQEASTTRTGRPILRATR